MRPGLYLNDGDNDHVGDADRDNSADNDSDAWLDYKRNDNGDYHDNDDASALSSYGQEAGAATTRAVAAVVQRYYAALAKGNGVEACRQMESILARTAAEDAKLGPRYLRGARSCPQIAGKLASHFHRQLTSGVRVTGVRVAGDRAVAELGSKKMPAGFITVERQDGAWRIGQLFGGPLV